MNSSHASPREEQRFLTYLWVVKAGLLFEVMAGCAAPGSQRKVATSLDLFLTYHMGITALTEL